jgi:hypothetical protein
MQGNRDKIKQWAPKAVKASHECKITMLWNQQVQTHRTIPNNKLDIIICDNKKGTYMLINVAILEDMW